MKRLKRALSSAAILVVTLAGTAQVHAAPDDELIRHCELTVIGRNADGSFETTRLVCRNGEAPQDQGATSSSVIADGRYATRYATGTLAVHYSGPNRTGSTLTINGGDCGGGWLNFPVAWVNQIASTYSHCNVTHHSSYYQTGSAEIIWAPGGNLGPLAYGAASATYW